jgi:ABC-type protease/lipase transport system fused ATPase/permease subunit
VFRAADKMLVLREGRVELFGPRDQVMARLVKPAQPQPPVAQPPQAASAGEVRAVEGGR